MLDRLHETIQAVCPIFGVSGVQGAITISFTPAATGPQQAAANAALAAFDWSQSAHDAWLYQQKIAAVGTVSMVRKSANQSRTAQTPADVTDLGFPLLPNKHYQYVFEGAYTADATTTGLRLAINGPASPALFRAIQLVYESATGVRVATSATYDNPVLGVNSGGSTALPFRVSGNISTNADGGMLILRFASEVAASNVTILAGSWGELKAIV